MSKIIALASNRNQAGKTTTALILKALDLWDYNCVRYYSRYDVLDLFHSRKQFVKDFVSDPSFFIDDYSPFEVKKFAAKLYNIVSEMTGKSVEWLYANKEAPLGEDWKSTTYYIRDVEGDELFEGRDYDEFLDQLELLEKNHPHEIEDQEVVIEYTPRLLLNVIGTQLFREQLHINVHVNMLFSDFYKGKKWIIDDMRFPNEWRKVVELGGKTIFVRRGKDQKGIVEGKLSGYSFDYTINNNGNLDDLINSCIYIWERIFS